MDVSHETVRQDILRHKYKSRVARKIPMLSAINIEKQSTFATGYNISQEITGITRFPARFRSNMTLQNFFIQSNNASNMLLMLWEDI